MKIVEVEWVDAQWSQEQISVEELKKYPLVHTKSCGYLIEEDEEKICLAFMLFGDDVVKHYQVIPKVMIKKIKVLKK